MSSSTAARQGRAGRLFQQGKRGDQLVEDTGGQCPAGLVIGGLLRDVVAADGEVIGQPGHRLARPGQAQSPAFPQDHGDLTAGRRTTPR